MKEAEYIYKCRNCKTGTIALEMGEVGIVGSTPTFVGNVSILTISTDKCPNCCLATTNNVTQYVIADLVKINVKEK